MFVRDLGVEQRGIASCGALRAARTAPQAPQTVLAVDFAHGETVLTRETKALAGGMDTRESSEVELLHAILL